MTPDDITSLLDAIPLPLLLIDRDQKVSALNTAATGLFDSTARGRHYITVLRQPALLDCIDRALTTGERQTANYQTRETSYETAYDVTASPFQDGVLLSFKETGSELAAGQMRRDFVANVSHELRSPLTAMLGFIETLRGPARDDAATRDRFLGIMQAEAGRMNRLIQDLLSLARVEDNERLRPTGQVDVVKVLDRALATLQKSGGEEGSEITVHGNDQPKSVQGDADQLLQVLTNLIENAIKYGGTQITITLSQLNHDPDLRAPAIRFEIADNGPGIDPLHLPRLTERFYRVDGHRARALGGTGLGLAIVKHIVNRHRGRLRIESQPGQGSRFSVTLPATINRPK